jgi:hypothetical protein
MALPPLFVDPDITASGAADNFFEIIFHTNQKIDMPLIRHRFSFFSVRRRPFRGRNLRR